MGQVNNLPQCTVTYPNATAHRPQQCPTAEKLLPLPVPMTCYLPQMRLSPHPPGIPGKRLLRPGCASMEGMSAAEPTPAHTFTTVRRLEAPLIAEARAQGHPDALMERAAMGVADAARGLLERPRGGLRPSAVDPWRPGLDPRGDPRGHAPDSGAEPTALPYDIPAPPASLSSVASHGPSQSPSPHRATHDGAPEGE